MSLNNAILIDSGVLVACVLALWSKCTPRLSHPGVIYLIFHASVISARAIALEFGANRTLNVTDAEASRALLTADLLLVVMTVVFVAGGRKGEAHPAKLRADPKAHSITWIPLSTGYIIGLATVCVPVGIYSLLSYGFVPGRESATAQVTSSYQIFAISWPGLMITACIYKWGFRWYLTVPMAGFLLLMAIQGGSRFRFILPILLLAQIWLDRRGRLRPPLWMVAGGVAIVALFIPLKAIGMGIQSGTLQVSGIEAVIKESAREAVRGDNSEQSVFDQYAASLTLSDNYGSPLFGQKYLALATLPIPRSVWPEKPGLADSLEEISTFARPLGTIGAVTLFPGDLYTDFRIPGMVAFGALFAAILQRWYTAAYRAPYMSVGRFTYLVVASVLIQVYRDGPLSLPLFLIVNNLPLIILAVLHWRGLYPRRGVLRTQRAIRAPGQSASVREGV